MQRSDITHLLSRALLPVGCFLLASYFASHALLGTTGIFARDAIRREQVQLSVQRDELQARQSELKRNIALLDPRGVDPDYADELVRRHLGVVRPDEVIIPFTKEPQAR